MIAGLIKHIDYLESMMDNAAIEYSNEIDMLNLEVEDLEEKVSKGETKIKQLDGIISEKDLEIKVLQAKLNARSVRKSAYIDFSRHYDRGKFHEQVKKVVLKIRTNGQNAWNRIYRVMDILRGIKMEEGYGQVYYSKQKVQEDLERDFYELSVFEIYYSYYKKQYDNEPSCFLDMIVSSEAWKDLFEVAVEFILEEAKLS